MIRAFLRTEPVAITGVITATVGVLITTGVVDEVVGGSIVTALGAWALVIRQAVTPNDHIRNR